MNAALRSAGFSPLQRQVFSGMSAYFCARYGNVQPQLEPHRAFCLNTVSIRIRVG